MVQSRDRQHSGSYCVRARRKKRLTTLILLLPFRLDFLTEPGDG